MDSKAIQEWLLTNIVPIILVVIGIGIMARAKKGNWSETLNITGITIIGIIFVVGGAAFIAFGTDLVGVVFKS